MQISGTSQLYGMDSLISEVQTVMEKTDQVRDNILSYLYVQGESDIEEIRATLDISGKEMDTMLRELERGGLVNKGGHWVSLTAKGKKKALKNEETDLEEATKYAAYDPNTGKLEKVFKNKKEAQKWVERQHDPSMADPKYKKMGDEVETDIRPYNEETDLEEASSVSSIGDKHQKKIAIDTVKNPMKGKLLGGMSEKEAIKILKTKFGYSDSQIEKLQKEETDLEEAAPNMVNGVEALLYAIMAEGLGTGKKNEAPIETVERSLVQDFSIVDRQVPQIIKAAQKVGFVNIKNGNFVLTPQADDFIRNREA